MRFAFSEQGRLIELVLLCSALWGIESIIPLFRYPAGRLRHRIPNVALTAILVFTNFALSFASAGLVAYAGERRIGLLYLRPLPPLATLACGILALDLLAYLAHVLLRKTALGWRFHRVHHCDPRVDVTTAFRQHPGETVWRIGWQLVGSLLLGVPLWVVAAYLLLSTTNAELEHANVRVPARIDRFVRLLFVTPNMHKVHHSRDQRETDSNYSNIFSVWDRLLGTHTPDANLALLRYGLDDVEARRAGSLPALLWLPFQR